MLTVVLVPVHLVAVANLAPCLILLLTMDNKNSVNVRSEMELLVVPRANTFKLIKTGYLSLLLRFVAF
jgi:hypothetical protein